jgi:agmatinase
MSENTCPDMPPSQESTSDGPFLKFPTFMGTKLSQNFLSNDVDVVISGVPFDLASTERPGARFGPAAIRQASQHLAWEINRWPWDFHVFDEIRAIDCGDLCFDPPTIDGMMVQLQHTALLL